MADIIINGIVYSNVTAVKVKDTSGNIVTFELEE